MNRKKTTFLLIPAAFCLFLFTGSPVLSGQSGGKAEGTRAAMPQPAGSCEDRLLEATAKYSKGDYSGALPLYDRLIEKEAACSGELKGEAHYGRGRAKEGAHDFRGAVADYNTALQLNPDSVKFREALGRGHYNLGNQKERLGDFKGAMADYLKALQYNPDSREASEGIAGLYYARGLEKQQKGELKGAMEEFNKALRHRPNFPEAREAKKNLDTRLQHKASERDGMFTF